jgi:hypothetical protein
MTAAAPRTLAFSESFINLPILGRAFYMSSWRQGQNFSFALEIPSETQIKTSLANPLFHKAAPWCQLLLVPSSRFLHPSKSHPAAKDLSQSV